MKNRAYIVNAFWDTEAKVWVATSEDVPGLATEASDIDRLIKKLRVMIPELLEANGLLGRKRGRTVLDLPFEVRAEYRERLRLQA
jgi:predicted RNase H-like HicB family nuclease